MRKYLIVTTVVSLFILSGLGVLGNGHKQETAEGEIVPQSDALPFEH
ncbi:hypothetical protein [Bacillus marinisedimentorum]|nr:hypothetical protein [Bacillus marinisedimentorum]